MDDDNDDFGQAANNNTDTDVNLDLFECNLNQELKNLMKMHEQTKVEIAQDMSALKYRILTHKEPNSLKILQQKINKEREYL